VSKVRHGAEGTRLGLLRHMISDLTHLVVMAALRVAVMAAVMILTMC
jgi:hypothetical protein